MTRLPTVKEHMDRVVHVLGPEMPILDAVDFLLEHHVTGAPVVDESGRILGMLSEKDCLKLLAKGVDGEIPQGTVSDFMTTELVTIPPDMNVYFAAGLFLSLTVRRLPVVEDGKLVGAITRFDILRVIQANLRR